MHSLSRRWWLRPTICHPDREGGEPDEAFEVSSETPAPPIPAVTFPFALDRFQQEAIQSLEKGRNVVVCAPTGAGKTVVAEYATHLAISRGQRCFYTTPLKALSNQKFFDFRDSLGVDGVGLLTGDTSVNRDGSVVVMTTEVYRNMLYGTTLGEVRRNLEGVHFVVLDECHFMNDVDRGTVWEESVIYSPPQVQLLALSATVANAEELRRWMENVHGPTDLLISVHRPVPLRYYFFTDRRMHRLLTPDGKLNPHLARQPAPSSPPQGRGPRLGGDRRRTPPAHPRPEFEDVCHWLDRRDMLPAIFFVFSRKGCEEALRRPNLSVALTQAEEQELHERIAEALELNPTLATHPHLPYLYLGVAAHHAGLLPSWKSLVERLFVRGLVKVVFATETLAAGINMPARTTVISAISKRCDDGHRHLTASEFLQMSGRAGRRGMDVVGNVVVLSHPNESVDDAARLARAHPDPLVSQFTPSYGMVLNLLQRHHPDQCRELLERSFGQFMASINVGHVEREKLDVEARIRSLEAPLCPDEPGDLDRYRSLYDRLRATRKQLKSMNQGQPRKGHRPDPADPLEEARRRLNETARQQLDDARAMPCHGCPVQEACARQDADLRRLHNRRSAIQRQVRQVSTPYWNQFRQIADLLEDVGYLRDSVPTSAGRMAASLRAANVLVVAEVMLSGLLDTLQPEDAAAAITGIVTDETRRQEYLGLEPSESGAAALEQVVNLARRVDRLQRRYGIEVPIVVNPIYAGLAQEWARGADWETMRKLIPMDEGDVVRCLRRTVDLARQMARAPESPQATAAICGQVEKLLARDEVREELLAPHVPADLVDALKLEEAILLEELLEEDEVVGP